MGRWITGWRLAREILLTLTGLTIIGYEVFGASHPVDLLIFTGMALCGIGAGFSVKSIATGYFGTQSSSLLRLELEPERGPGDDEPETAGERTPKGSIPPGGAAQGP